MDEVGQAVGTRSDVAEELRGLLQALQEAQLDRRFLKIPRILLPRSQCALDA